MLGYKHKDIIFELNRQAFRFAQQHDFEKGWNRELWDTELWNIAKQYIIYHELQINKQLTCWVCGKVIYPIRNKQTLIERYKCTLHHIKYKFRAYFSPKYVKLVHHHCHELYHKQLRELRYF